MDPITHGLIGAATSYALFGHKLGKRSALIGAVAGMAPDLDNFVSSEKDVLLYVEFHRAFTHSIFFAIIGSLMVVLPWILQQRFRPQWKLFWMCSLPAYLTHCLLDASTTYGTQILWPFTRHRYGWDLIAVVDPLFTGALIIGLALSLTKNKRMFAMISVIFCILYLGLGGIQKTRAHLVQRELASHRGHVVERSEIMPTLANLVVWRSLYLSNGQIYSDRIRVGWLSEPSYKEGTALPLSTSDNLTPLETEGNAKTRAFDRFAWFSDSWVARAPFDQTVLGDMRYSISPNAFDPIWGIRFTKNADQIKIDWVNRQLDRDIRLDQLWAEILGKHPDYKPL